MSRLELAYLLVALLIGGATAIVVLSYRYSRYLRAVRHGARNRAPVWRPFWMN